MAFEKPKIAALRHRVKLCSQKDVIIDGELSLARAEVLEVWASIDPIGAQTFGSEGQSINPIKNKRSHVIMIRYRYDIEISALAWLYEPRMKSSPRWFKILRSTQSEGGGTEWYRFECRLMERSDLAVAPDDEDRGPARGMPDGVEL